MSRPIFHALDTPGQVRIISHNVADEKFERWWIFLGLCTGNCASLCKAKELTENTYVTVYENKVEFNYPCAYCCCFCCCCTYDRHAVVYFDRDVVRKADKESCCTPYCTHNQCFPTCCDLCGETVILYGAKCCSEKSALVPFQTSANCCKHFVELPGMRDAAGIAAQIEKQQEIARSKASAPGHIAMHSMT